MHALLGIMLLISPGTMQPKAPATACSAPEYRQFDFWVGRWEVHNAKRELAGRNRIEVILSGCALQEHWEGRKGMTGTSINFYSRADGLWHQTWVDTDGMRLELAGSLVDARMVLIGESASLQEPGRKIRHRITWSPLGGGRVRQHWETSRDEGSAWMTVFDGTYTRVNPGEERPHEPETRLGQRVDRLSGLRASSELAGFTGFGSGVGRRRDWAAAVPASPEVTAHGSRP